MALNDDILNHFFRGQAVTTPGQLYLALYTVAPNLVTGVGGTEVGGGSYARQAITLAAPANGYTTNTVAIDFPGMPAVNVVAGGLYDAASGGSFVRAALFSSIRTVTAGKTFTVTAGSLIVQVR